MMSALSLSVIAERLGAPYEGAPLAVSGITIDSRAVTPGDLFVALPGERVDGHNYIDAAVANGAIAALVEHPVDADVPCLRVSSCLAALSDIGRASRDFSRSLVIAITGSCGKTTVKNLCRSIFTQAGPTVATAGNYNNEIGVPLTLARLDDETRFAIVEMGATRRGDIAHLCALARPSITTVLNAMEAHLEGFGSVADVADIKAEIFDGLGAQGTAILNLDQPWVSLWRERIARAGADTVSYSLGEEGDITVADLRDLGLQGSEFTLRVHGEEQAVRFPLPGRHSVANALAAAALATAAGLDLGTIVTGLEQAEAESGRLRAESLGEDKTLIDDSYNANPGSVRAAIDLLAATAGNSLLILGEMLELGEESAERHREMGARAREQGVTRFVGIGDALKPAVETFGSTGQWYPTRDALTAALPELLEQSDTLLVKGSRGAAMESVLVAIRDTAREAGLC
ncbi:UDP-N-acetylmuramoyl-tripeptide--D-alanyl-D-alanine ligase [Congregibacter litoralis]|uniref:UDP-N-acetylmuramoyl-tripeptide--D-alanyl-D-alanine ligase n=1 Tax=Congregibacter litoralis KT71 TaxID=314285 RepID=A4A5F6_9GAMM|nr:UDP-N-acetylmuramoyl-tripeptide--D-alanyl-D-alanine ligase [Congregibacter litoralis]EAQ99027.1 UDP-N-acetylmuramoyl-tripeptide--D-alanyl-D-alanine ligase [Congregibacter litoralis KT71]